MKSKDALMNEFTGKYERFLIGCDAIEEEGLWDKDEFGEMDVFYQNDLVGVILRLIASDGKIEERETEILAGYFGFDLTPREARTAYESFRSEAGASFDEEIVRGYEKMRGINRKLADAYKDLLSLVCEIVISCDGVVEAAEIEEAKRVKNLLDAR